MDAHTRSAQMGNTVDVNENEYAVASFEQKLAAVRRLETAVIQWRRRKRSSRLFEMEATREILKFGRRVLVTPATGSAR